MKAISIHQPFVSMIVDPHDRLPLGILRKRIENRKWIRKSLLGETLLLHATLDRRCIEKTAWPLHLVKDMPFGAIVGLAKVEAFVKVEGRTVIEVQSSSIVSGTPDLSWVVGNQHAEGPWCWILKSVRRFREPIPQKGRQGIFEVEMNAVLEAAIAMADIVPPFSLGSLVESE
jgi:hypothetical protein